MDSLKYVAGACPKLCGRESGYEVIGVGVWIVCTCGFRKLRYELNHEGILLEVSLPKNTLKLPKIGTRLRNCLLIVEGAAKVTTREAALIDGSNSGDMATQLTLLEGKGLVRKLNSLRRVAGGSTWTLTVIASELLSNISKE